MFHRLDLLNIAKTGFSANGKDFSISRLLPFTLQSEGKDRGRDPPPDAAPAGPRL
jgi:hypothetical protein